MAEGDCSVKYVSLVITLIAIFSYSFISFGYGDSMVADNFTESTPSPQPDPTDSISTATPSDPTDSISTATPSDATDSISTATPSESSETTPDSPSEIEEIEVAPSSSPMPSTGINNQTNPKYRGGSSDNVHSSNSSQPTVWDESTQMNDLEISEAGPDQGLGVISNNTSDVEPTVSNNSTVDHVTGSPTNSTQSAVQIPHAVDTVNETADIMEGLRLLPSSTASEEIAATSDATSIQSPVIVSVQLSEGTDQAVSFRDVTNNNNVSSDVLSIDKSSFSIGDEAKIKVTDPEANLDGNKEDVVFVIVNSTSDSVGMFLELRETGLNSGVFEGTFGTTADPTNGNKIQTKEGEKIQVLYMGTHPRLEVQFSEVTKEGMVEISDYAIPIPPGQRLSFDPIGGAVNLTLVDSQVSPEGTMTVTLSYANVVLGGQHVDSLTIMEDIGDGNWLNLIDVCADTSGAGVPFCPDPPIIIDTESKTVTATVPYVPGSIYVPGNSVKFTLAVCASCGPGGLGGGLAFPGSGVVLDLILPILSPPSPPPSTSPSPAPVLSSGIHSENLISSSRERNPLLDQGNITLVSNGLILENLTNQKANETKSQILNNTEISTPRSLIINGTVVFPHMGNLSVRLLSNDSDQQVDVIEVTSKKDLGELNLIFDGQEGKTVVTDINNISYVKVGPIYEPVLSCNCINDPKIEISIPYDVSIVNSISYASSSTSQPEDKLGVKLLHYDNGRWVDVTTEVVSANDKVTGIIDHLSPVMAVLKLTHENA